MSDIELWKKAQLLMSDSGGLIQFSRKMLVKLGCKHIDYDKELNNMIEEERKQNNGTFLL